jgi:hypothetical protein
MSASNVTLLPSYPIAVAPRQLLDRKLISHIHPHLTVHRKKTQPTFSLYTNEWTLINTYTDPVA